ncbi:MAG: zinc-ribbon domain-containing protein, partial [Gammaproteobacteria bacterium]|nr:zinc-ribbon domain-containing protein [Gammaproteobacteria bacterium]
MYTCCPECETTFRLSADDLRLARGQVRCGECDHVFNALEYLSEENTEVEVAEAEAAVSDVSNDDTVFSLDTEPANDELAESPDDDATEDYGLDEESGLDDTGTGLLVTDEDDDDATKAWNEPADGEYEEEDAAAESMAIFGYADDDGLTPDEAEAEELVLADVEEEGEEGEGEEELEDDEFGYDIDSGETEDSMFEVSDAEDETA